MPELPSLRAGVPEHTHQAPGCQSWQAGIGAAKSHAEWGGGGGAGVATGTCLHSLPPRSQAPEGAGGWMPTQQGRRLHPWPHPHAPSRRSGAVQAPASRGRGFTHLRAALGGSEHRHSQVLETPHDPCTEIQKMQASVCQRLPAQVSPLGGDARDQGTAV